MTQDNFDHGALTQGGEDSHPVDIAVGKKLRARRNLLGLSQEALAEKANITFQQIQKYETAKNRISASRLHDLARILETNISYFFEDFSAKYPTGMATGMAEQDQEAFEEPDDILSRKETMDLLRSYYAIKDPKLRSHFLKILKEMGKNSPQNT
jgi:transcriptional regulator with XRE-family HTH domain